MSLWSRETIRAVLAPDHVLLRRSDGRMAHGRVADRAEKLPCRPAEAGIPAWQPALQALTAALPAFRNGNAKASVVLSNHFVRYAMVPEHADLADVDEERAFARHCFVRTYGAIAEQWDLRLERRHSVARLASAVDADLIEGVRAAFREAGVPLESIQPHLMAAFNTFQRGMGRKHAWFAVVEPGNLCLLRTAHGHVSRVRSMRTGRQWREDLIALLARESYLDDGAEAPPAVFVWCGTRADIRCPEHLPWQISALVPPPGRPDAALTLTVEE